jgi:hypothetical protein
MTYFNKVKWLLLATLLMGGCSSTKIIYHNDGSIASVASCVNSSWLDCYEVAGEKCKEAGYEVLEKITSRNTGYWSSSDIRQMMFICKPLKQNISN